MSAKYYVGNQAMKNTVSTQLPSISKIVVVVDEDNSYEAGDNTGYSLEVFCPYGTQAMATALLSDAQGFVYKGFTSESAQLPPEAELGDGVTIDRVYSMIANKQLSFTPKMTASIAAPVEEEVDHEYPYTGTVRKEVERKVTLGTYYYGVAISKLDGIKISRTDGKAEAVFNSDKFEMRALVGGSMVSKIYFDATTGEYVFDGKVTITGGSIAPGTDIADMPTAISQLANDSGFTDETGVVTIVDGHIDADYVNALGITAGAILIKNSSDYVLLSAGGTEVSIAGWNVREDAFYSGTTLANSNCFMCLGSSEELEIAGNTATGWVLKAGSTFGVTDTGGLWCTDANISGVVNATSGFIGTCEIIDDVLYWDASLNDTASMGIRGLSIWGDYSHCFIEKSFGHAAVGFFDDDGQEFAMFSDYGFMNGYWEYNDYEIATLNDIPDISGLESDIQWVNYQITDPGAILDRLDDLEGRVYNLENP